MTEINFPELGQSFAVNCKKPKGEKRGGAFRVSHFFYFKCENKLNCSTKKSKVCMRGKAAGRKHNCLLRLTVDREMRGIQ